MECVNREREREREKIQDQSNFPKTISMFQ